MPVSRLWCIDTTAPKSGSGCRAPAATRDRAFWRSWAETKTARGRSKHDGIQNFTTSLNPADWSRQVPIGRLGADLSSGRVPAFSWVIPDECHDQHGDPPYCIDSGTPGGSDPQDQRLVAVGDQYLGQLVGQITHASFWAKGNNAIDIVYDEGDTSVGGGGQVASVAITSHGPRNLQDPAAYSHYSLLATILRNFGLP